MRAPEPADVDAIFAIQRDPVSMRFTYCSPSREATLEFLEVRAGRFGEDGYAPWTVVLEAERRVIGWGGLGKDPAEPLWGPEVAYFLDPAFWGQGLASELVAASLEYAFDELALPEVSAFARPDNLASIRVLSKAGFERLEFVAGLERDLFRIHSSVYRNAAR